MYRQKLKKTQNLSKKITSILALTTIITSSYYSQAFAAETMIKSLKEEENNILIYLQANRSIFNSKYYEYDKAQDYSITGGLIYDLSSFGRLRFEVEGMHSRMTGKPLDKFSILNLTKLSSIEKHIDSLGSKFDKTMERHSRSNADLNTLAPLSDSLKEKVREGFAFFVDATSEKSADIISGLISKEVNKKVSNKVDFNNLTAANAAGKSLVDLHLTNEEIGIINEKFKASNVHNMDISDETKMEEAKVQMKSFLKSEVKNVLEKRSSKIDEKFGKYYSPVFQELSSQNGSSDTMNEIKDKYLSGYDKLYASKLLPIARDAYSESDLNAAAATKIKAIFDSMNSIKDSAGTDGKDDSAKGANRLINFKKNFHTIIDALRDLKFTENDIKKVQEDFDNKLKDNNASITTLSGDNAKSKFLEVLNTIRGIALTKSNEYDAIKKSLSSGLKYGELGSADNPSDDASTGSSDNADNDINNLKNTIINFVQNRAIVSANYDINVSSMPRLKVHVGVGAGYGIASRTSVVAGKDVKKEDFNDFALLYKAGLTYQISGPISINAEYRSVYDFLSPKKSNNNDSGDIKYLSNDQFVVGMRYEF